MKTISALSILFFCSICAFCQTNEKAVIATKQKPDSTILLLKKFEKLYGGELLTNEVIKKNPGKFKTLTLIYDPKSIEGLSKNGQSIYIR